VTDGERVFVGAALVTDDVTFHAYLVEALDAENGALLWQDAVDKGGEVDYLEDLDVHEGRVFAVGFGGAQCRFDPAPTNCNSLVRAYDAATGALPWDLELDASGTGQDDFASTVIAANGMVFVVSQQPPLRDLLNCCTVGTWLVQAFDGPSGQLLWESPGGPLESAVYNMIVHRGRLVIPGRSVDSATGDWDFIVRAYDTRGAGID
jgi:outer membrane protein assembly factor BamB